MHIDWLSRPAAKRVAWGLIALLLALSGTVWAQDWMAGNALFIHDPLPQTAVPASNRQAGTAFGLDAMGTVRHDSVADLAGVQPAGAVWLTETVDLSGRRPDLALDSAGRPHVSYYDCDRNTLMYAYRDDFSWHTEKVSGGVECHSHGPTSLDLDSADHPHVSYYNANGNVLGYAHHDGTAWMTETVDGSWQAGLWNSLEVDAQGHPHISYQDGSLTYLRYAYHDGSTWHTETVDNGPNAGLSSSLALDRFGRPHIAHFIGWTDVLRYTWHDGSSWLSANMGWGKGFWAISLILDSFDRAHISTWRYDTGGSGSGELLYVAFDGSSWQEEVLVRLNPYYLFHTTAIALDGDDRPHITFVSTGGLYLTYDLGAGWQTEAVDRGGGDSTLALDRADQPHIVYCDADNRLVYATRLPQQRICLPMLVRATRPEICAPGDSPK